MQIASTSQIDSDNIWIFSAIDKMLEQHRDNKMIFTKLYERKNDLLNLVQNLKIDAQKYKKIMKKSSKSENPLIKACATEDLLKLQDQKDPAKCFQWFKEMIDQTGNYLQQQEALHKKLTESAKSVICPISAVKSIIRQTQIRKTQRSFVKQQINQKQIVSLKAADNILKKYQCVPETYEKVLDRKMKMISLINKNELTAPKYKKNLEKYLTLIKNEDILFDTKRELEGLTDFYQGNLDLWFKQIVEEAKQSWKEQKRIMLKLNPSLRSGIFSSQSIVPLSKQPSGISQPSMIHPPLPLPLNSRPILQPQKQSIIAQNSTVKLPSRLPEKSFWENNKQISLEKQPSKILKQTQLKNIHSFSVLQKLLEDNFEDVTLRKDLQAIKNDLLQKHKKGQLNAQKYKALIEKDLNECVNQDAKMCIELQISLIKDIHDGNIEEWYKDIIEAATDINAQQIVESIDKSKGDAISDLLKPASNFKENQQQQSNIKVSYVKSSKIQDSAIIQTAMVRNKVAESQYEFLKQMAAYESWLYLCKKHQIPYDSNKYLVKYEKEIRVKTDDYLKQIAKEKDLNIDNLTRELFPVITEDIFYGGSLEKYQKQEIPKMIDGFQKEQATLKNYISNIRKQYNQENIQTAHKQIGECSENINYLKKWPNFKYEPLPLFSQEKVIKHNIDSNHLELDQLELEVINIQGLASKLDLQIYINSANPNLVREIENGTQGIKVVGKCSEEAMKEIMRGKGQHLKIVIVEKGFFGAENIKGQQYLQPIFTRSNTRQCEVQIAGVKIKLLAKVQKAGQPLTTEVLHCTLRKFPRYQHSNFVQQQLIKKHMLYSNPTPSQIHRK